MHAEKIYGGADMTPEEYIAVMHDGLYLEKGTELTACMRPMAREAQKITAEINGAYHTPEEQRALMSELTGKPVDEGFALFPPIYTDCGRNLTIGKNVFINSGCCFQDQGGVTIGDGCLIGHQVVFATLDHMLDPSDRASMVAHPITVGRNVWIGSHATILSGVTIGDNSVIAAGAVVTKAVPANCVAAGVPARIIKSIE